LFLFLFKQQLGFNREKPLRLSASLRDGSDRDGDILFGEDGTTDGRLSAGFAWSVAA